MKEVIVLYEFENYSYEKIADKLKIPQGTVKSRINNARKILKEHYDKLEAVANVLMEKEKISGEEFDRIIDGVPANDAE